MNGMIKALPTGILPIIAGSTMLCACGGKSPAPVVIDAREHVPHSAIDERENPYLGTQRAEDVEGFFREYNYQRFGKGLRMGMSEAEVVRLAEVPARKRYTGTIGEEEFTFTWPREDTGFRVMMREGRVVAWMSERAVFLEPERLGR